MWSSSSPCPRMPSARCSAHMRGSWKELQGEQPSESRERRAETLSSRVLPASFASLASQLVSVLSETPALVLLTADLCFFSCGFSLRVLPHSFFLPAYLRALRENFPLLICLLTTQVQIQSQIQESRIICFLHKDLRPRRSSIRQQPSLDPPTTWVGRRGGVSYTGPLALRGASGFPRAAGEVVFCLTHTVCSVTGSDGSWISVKAVKVQVQGAPNKLDWAASSQLAAVHFVVVDFWRQLIPVTEVFSLFHSCTTDHCYHKKKWSALLSCCCWGLYLTSRQFVCLLVDVDWSWHFLWGWCAVYEVLQLWSKL